MEANRFSKALPLSAAFFFHRAALFRPATGIGSPGEVW
jgi:hypothetical protein